MHRQRDRGDDAPAAPATTGAAGAPARAGRRAGAPDGRPGARHRRSLARPRPASSLSPPLGMPAGRRRPAGPARSRSRCELSGASLTMSSPANRSASRPSGPSGRARPAAHQPEVLDPERLLADLLGEREERPVGADLAGVRAHRRQLRRQVGRAVDARGHQLVAQHERQVVDRVDAEEAALPRLDHQLDAALQRRARHRGPVDLGHRPRLAGLRRERRVGRRVHRGHRDPVRLDVVRVAVAAVLVVGDQHLRAHLAHDRDQLPGRLVEVGPPEGAGRVVLRQAHHAAVPPPARAAEEPVVGDARAPASPRSARGPGSRRAGRPRPRPAAASAGTSTSPSSPSVQVTSVTWAPSAAYRAITAPVPMVSSSGWACTSSSRRAGTADMAPRLVRGGRHSRVRPAPPAAPAADSEQGERLRVVAGGSGARCPGRSAAGPR